MSDSSSDPHLSVDAEPWLKAGNYKPDPSESRQFNRGSKAREIDNIRDSVFSEHEHQGARPGKSEFGQWLEEKRKSTTRLRSLVISLLVALIGGPFAIAGAFMAGRQTAFGLIYIILFGPVAEEVLKQSGMIYLLERKPYHVFSRWQLVAGAFIGAALFATVENLIYVHVYFASLPPDRLAFLAAFRWRVCTSLHITCSLITSLGMIKIWQRHTSEGKPIDLSTGYPHFVAAIAVHGIYNLAAVLTHCIGYF